VKRRQKQAVILALANGLIERGSWCGETHLQKATYFLEELTSVPLKLGFVLYKHGPFSFELRDEITAMRADGLLKLLLRPYPYGPSLHVADSGHRLQQRWPKCIEKYAANIAFVADRLGDLGVAELERLATALYVTRKHPRQSIKKRTSSLCALKPHISSEDAQAAVGEVDKMIAEWAHCAG